jgi:rRNA maturation endonuclease Nob1
MIERYAMKLNSSRWKKYFGEVKMNKFLYLCSACDYKFPYHWKDSKPYCPLCGQKESSMIAEYVKR